MCAAASVVIDSTRFRHGFAGNLRRNMEALNFSQPTRRHNGKAGGEGRGRGRGRGCDAGIITCTLAAAELLERQHGGSAAFVLKLEREVKKKNSSHFGFSQSSGQ